MAAKVESKEAHPVAVRVEPLARRAAQRCGCECVSVGFATERSGWVLRVVIDREDGVNVDHCAKVSRQLSAMLDVEDVVPYAYTLEVSSPGLDKELLVASDYRRYAGRQVRIRTREDVEGQRVFRGVLKGLSRGIVEIAGDEGSFEIPMDRVAEARLEVEI